MPVLAHMPVEYARNGDATVKVEPMMHLLLEHCREMNNRFLILDVPRGLHERSLLDWSRRFRARGGPNSSYGALYYPWLMAGDRPYPPSGAVAGLYARIDLANEPFGVRYPPANQTLEGFTHLEFEIRWSESSVYVEHSINPILMEPARGIVVWGARTLSEDHEWRHINTRRIVSYVSEQIRRDSEWLVFENQSPQLWHIIRRQVGSRLEKCWEAGLLTGDAAEPDYLVRCDDELNPPATRDSGYVNVTVRLKPVSTAENIWVELRLGSSGSME